ncbi:sensor histidine kinase [Nitrincola tapanii]|uniref:histidine kinase n=1 Tax=Nitrincola tapanii TaxID=1708751 RepID=A0A5A9W4K8_9GAMM|nr:cache domain-containing protein [Nitrincola tapanii]KAA0875075.1 HAMP domain-containing protein [Nitrincola tapanii]
MSLSWRQSVRGRLVFLILTPILLTLLALIALTTYWTRTYTDRQLYMKVASDLAVARSTLQLMQERQLEHLHFLAQAFELTELDSATLARWQEVYGLDYLRLLPSSAQHSLTSSLPSSAERLHTQLQAGEALRGLSVLSAQELASEFPHLVAAARVEILDTPRARPSDAREETRAMFVRSLYPLRDAQGEVQAWLDAGVLMNHNLEFVDQIRDLVYGRDALPSRGIGTVTLFLDEVRISTNVPRHLEDEDFIRAIGTRISADVAVRVLDQQAVWLDRAFVVSDWFISAYEPLYDLQGELIGMLYAGFSEGPFVEMYRKTLGELGITLLLILLVSAVLVWRSAYALFAPIRHIHRSVLAVQSGDSSVRIGPLKHQDELALLAQEFDSMLDELDARQEHIRQAAERLEQKVTERTASLQEKTAELEASIELLKATRAELFTKEKLAVLGELTAGIAHEINNPAAVILGHMDLLLAELGEDAQPVQEEIDTVIEQVYRIQAIINNLLQYSRPGQMIDQLHQMEVNRVVKDTLSLVRHALEKKGIQVLESYQAQGEIEGNRQQLQQVLVNLLLNAAHALPEQGGEIRLSTQPWLSKTGTEGVEICVQDNGCGMPAEVAARIFEPFYTTRENGNGLGLSISQSLVRRYGGDLCVESKLGVGSRFCIHLHRQAQINPEDEATMQQLLSGLGVV